MFRYYNRFCFTSLIFLFGIADQVCPTVKFLTYLLVSGSDLAAAYVTLSGRLQYAMMASAHIVSCV
jgi:hypothetical protein